MSISEFESFRDFLNENSGLVLNPCRYNQLAVAVEEQRHGLGLANPAEYLDYLRHGRHKTDALQRLINELTITETYFFRNKPHFEVLKNQILAQIAKDSQTRSLKIWSAGCSSGEEPYTIAMILDELSCLFENWHLDILGTDVNTMILDKAEKACYLEHSIKLMDPYYLAKYFTKTDQGYQLSDKIRKMVRFEKFNLIHEPYPLERMHDFDIIFCRNVTIYFKKESTKRVIHNFYNSLKDGGYLFIGHAESLYNINTDFVWLDLNDTYLYRKGIFHSQPESSPDQVDEPFSTSPTPPPAVIEETTGELLARARRHLRDNEEEKAVFCFNQVLRKEPLNLEPFLYQGQLYAGKGFYGEALKMYQRALQIEPLNAGIHFLVGLVYWEQGNLDEAVGYFKKGRYLDLNFYLPHYYLGLWYEQNGNRIKAINEYRAVLKLLSGDNVTREGITFTEFETSEILNSCAEKINQLEAKT